MSLAVHSGHLYPQTNFEKIKQFLSRSYRRSEVEKVVAHLQRFPSIDLANRLISKYGRDPALNKILTSFDRQMAFLRPSYELRHPENVKSFEKWEKAGLPPLVFEICSHFVNFLFESHLVSQIKVSRGEAVRMIRGEPHLWVEGKWVGEMEFMRRFELIDCARFKQKFIIDKRTRNVYTYLDNGLGLQKHHPYLSDPIPVSKLNEVEYASVWNKASQFIRPEETTLTAEERAQRNAQRPFILQIVNVIEEKGNTNFAKTFKNPRHAYLRIIAGRDLPEMKAKKGDVFEIGLERSKPYSLPLSLLTGQFRSPDIQGYISSAEKLVTNVPLDQESALSVFNYCLQYHHDNVRLGRKISFHIASQNCAVFIREACKAGGIHLPTEVTLPGIIASITPDWMHQTGELLKKWKNRALASIEGPLSKKFISWLRFASDKVSELWFRFWQSVFSLLISPVRLLLGDAFGVSGLAFELQNGKRRQFFPPLLNFSTVFDFRVNLTSRIQQWQLEQASTVSFKKPVRMAL